MSISQNFPAIRPTLNLNFARSKTLDPRITFTRSSTATYVGNDGLVKTAGVNQTRFDHDPATGESLGLLIEEQRTNLMPYSSNTTIYGSGNVTMSRSTGLDGDSSSALNVIYASNSGSFILTSTAAVSAGNVYTFSVYIKKNVNSTSGNAGASMYSYFDNGIAGQWASTIYNEDGQHLGQAPIGIWKRYTKTITVTSGTGVQIVLPGYDTQGLDVDYFGAQIEQGSFPTSYIPTSGSQVTRSADTATFTSQEISTTGTLLSLGGGSPASPASYNSSEVDTSTSVITLNSQLSDSSTIPTLLYYPEPISGDSIRAMRAYTPIVKDGLVLHLDAGVDKSYPNSGTTWWDLSGQGNNGTLVNGPTYNGGNGGSLVFDGTNDRVTIVNSLPSLSNLTIELFLQTHVLDGSQDIFLDQLGSLRCELQSNRFNIHLGGPSGWFFTWQPSNTVLSPNTWYHFAWTWSSITTLSRIYVNGVEDADPLNHGSAAASLTGDITLGQHTPDTTYNWNGKMSSVKIYNRALSSTEILQNFNASRSRFNI